MSAEIELHALNAMSEVVGSGHVRRDSESCRYFSSDLFFEPSVLPIAVVSPATRDDVVRIVQIASNENVSIVPRGGGLSYTGGYLSQSPRCIILDTTRLTRIIEINEDDQYVTVEAGVTWQMLDEVVALLEQGLLGLLQLVEPLRAPVLDLLAGLLNTVDEVLLHGATRSFRGDWGARRAAERLRDASSDRARQTE